VLKNNTVVDNEIYMCAAGSITGARYNMTVAARMNTYDRNHYHVPDLTGTWWFDAAAKTFAAWRADGNDASGSQMTPCSYP